ncbi:MAG: hypothetical protein IJZ89_00235 [Clostridia bacterium]|nr:hypothetical protein [Clostridia bacterium]
MKKLSVILCIILYIVCVFCACGKASGGNVGSSEGKVTVREISNISEYTIIRGESASDIEKQAMTDLRSAIKKNTGAELKVGTDWGGSGSYEIIIGETGRNAGKMAMEVLGGDYDYMIKMDGNHIVIVGGTPEATLEAVSVFISNFIQNGKVYAPTGSGHSVLKDYPVEKLTINGKALSEYKFYYIKNIGSETAKKNSEFTEEARDRLGEKTGVRLELVQDISKGSNYIMVDTSELNYTKGAIKVEDGNLILYGSYHSIDYVMDYFFDTLLSGDVKEVDITENTELDSGDLPTVYSREDLMAVLQYSYDNNDVLIVGDEVGGNREVPGVFLDRYMNGDIESGGYRTGTGTYPSIMGLDLGRCGALLAFLEDHEWGSISQIVCESIDYAAQGGIVTIASHFRNPSLTQTKEWQSDRGTLNGAKDWVDLITPGTELNNNMMFELERVAKVLKAYDDAGVPIIWRPMHEMDGGWFWWTPEDGSAKLDGKYYVDFWKYIYDYFTNDWGLDNLIWHFSPSTSSSAMNYYPGDEYCDIVGCDWYTDGSSEIMEGHKPYEKLMETGKIANLAEIGISDSLMAENIKDQDNLYNAYDFFRTTVEAMYAEGYKIGFFATYTHKHTLAYLPGGDEIMQSEMVIDLSEMPALFEKATGFKVGG